MKVAVDTERFEAAGLGYAAEGALATFTLPANPEFPDKPRQTVSVRLEGDRLLFFPDRSSSHKAVLRLLGEAA